MNSVKSSKQYVSLKAYSDELEAENKAKTNEINTLTSYIKSLESRNTSSTVINSLVQKNCLQCKQKDRKIEEINKSLKLMTELKNKQKDHYEKKIKEYQERITKTSTTSYIVQNGIQSKNENLKDLQDLKHSQELLRKQIEQLKIEKQRRITELQKNLSDSKFQIQKQKNQYQSKLRLSNTSQSDRTAIYRTTNISSTQNKSEIDSLSQQISELRIRNSELQSKCDDLMIKQSKEWTTLKIDGSNSESHNSEIFKLKEQNNSLLAKIQFIEKHLFEVQQWNRVLRQQILVKMPTHHRQVCVEPLLPQTNNKILYPSAIPSKSISINNVVLSRPAPKVNVISPMSNYMYETNSPRDMNITQPNLNSQIGYQNNQHHYIDVNQNLQYNQNQSVQQRRGKIFKYQNQMSSSTQQPQMMQMRSENLQPMQNEGMIVSKKDEKTIGSSISGFFGTLFASDPKNNNQRKKK